MLVDGSEKRVQLISVSTGVGPYGKLKNVAICPGKNMSLVNHCVNY